MRFTSKVRIRSERIIRIGSLSQRFAHDESHYYARAGPGGAGKINQAFRAAPPDTDPESAPETVVAERGVAGLDTERRETKHGDEELRFVGYATSSEKE